MIFIIKKALSNLNFKKYKTFYVAGNIYNFQFSANETKKFSNFFLNELKKNIGKNKNIVVPTSTLNLIKNKKIFSKNETKSFNMGNFSEYVRMDKHSYRSDHPLWSFAGIGKNVKKILKDTSYSAYGKNSVFEKLLHNKTLFISMGKPHRSIGMLHYAEHIVGVPYRYNKELEIKVKTKSEIKKQYSLLGVRWDSKKIIGDGNKKILTKLFQKKIFKIIKLNKGELYIANYSLLVNELINILNKNPKIWLKNESVDYKKMK